MGGERRGRQPLPHGGREERAADEGAAEERAAEERVGEEGAGEVTGGGRRGRRKKSGLAPKIRKS